MKDEIVQETVANAVQQAYDNWAAQHPSLAAVIDRIKLTERTSESLRNSAEYADALAAFHRGLSETNFLQKLTELAGPVLTALLAA